MDYSSVDTKEFEFPDALLATDIENSVFQSMVLHVLTSIEGIGLLEKNILEDLLGRDESLRIKGIFVEQQEKSRSIKVKVELNVAYGVCLPKKAEEIQSRIIETLTDLTGLHVSGVHVVFKNLLRPVKETATTTQQAE